MTIISLRNATRTATHLLYALAMLAATHGAIASNTPSANAPEGFGAGTTGGGQTREIVTVRTRTDLARALCGKFGPDGLCIDNTPRIIKLSETIDFTNTESQTTKSVCYIGKICTAPNKNEMLIPLNSADHRCDGRTMYKVAVDNAGGNPLLIGSNKTLIGVGARAGLKGKGLSLRRVSNVIIRNITISDINEGIIFGGDAISIAEADRVWIDHNRFRGIARQMIVTHFGATTNITASWNIFDGTSLYSPNCNGQHYYNLLMGGFPETVTLSNNWFKNVSGRAPHVESTSATVHLVNNYYDNDELAPDAAHALDATNPQNSTTAVNVLVEGNYFHNITIPITDSSGNIFGALGGPNTSTQTQCKSTLWRNCYGNMAKPAPNPNRFVQDSVVMRTFQGVQKSAIAAPYTASEVPVIVPAHAGPGKI